MSSFRWRKFDFFDQEELAEQPREAGAGGAGSSSEPVAPGTAETLRSVAITCTCATAGAADGAPGWAAAADDGLLALGDASGDVHLVPRSLRLHSFRAHADEVSHVQLLRGGLWLATVGLERDGTPTRAAFKLWRLSCNGGGGGDGGGRAAELRATCVRICKLFATADAEAPVTALAVSECLTVAAIGLDTGAILLARTAAPDLSRERSLVFRVCAHVPPASGARSAGAGDGGASAANASDAARSVNSLFFSNLSALSDDAGGADAPSPSPSLQAPSAREPPRGLFVVSAGAICSLNVRAALERLHASPPPTPPTATTAAHGGGGGGGQAHALRSLDSAAGCARGCAALSPAGALAVARSDAIFMFGLEERGPCFAFAGPKRGACFSRGYLAVLSEGGLSDGGGAGGAAALAAAGWRAAPTPAADGADGADGDALGPISATLSLYDLRHKLVAHAQPAPARVRVLAGAWGGCALLTADGRAWRLRERPMASKLSALTARGQFEVAIGLASAHKCPQSEVGELRWRHALHLLSLGEPDGATLQLVETIGSIPAARVIRHLLNEARIEALAAYLEALHARAREESGDEAEEGTERGWCEGASLLRAEHTSLLLTCYLQLGHTDKASAIARSDGFRRAPDSHGGEGRDGGDGGDGARGGRGRGRADANGSPHANGVARSPPHAGPSPSGARARARARSPPPFDAATAIRLCREAGLLDEALELSERHGRHADHLSLLLDELKPPRAARALAYIAALPRAHTRAALRAHGKLLVDALPDRTTGLLMHHLSAQLAPPAATAATAAATAVTPAGGDAAAEATARADVTAAELAEVLRIYAQQPHWLMVLLEYLASLQHPALATHAARAGGSARAAVATTAGDAAAAAGVGGAGGAGGAPLLWETLIELYLTPDRGPDGSSSSSTTTTTALAAADAQTRLGARLGRLDDERAQGEDKALALLTGASAAAVSREHALVLCAQRSFERGVRAVLERSRAYALIVQRHLDRREHADAARACRAFAGVEPELWVRALRHWGAVYGRDAGTQRARSGVEPATTPPPSARHRDRGGDDGKGAGVSPSAPPAAPPAAAAGTADGGGGGIVGPDAELLPDTELLALIEEALGEVHRLGLLTPTLALHDLARNPAMPLAPVRALLLRHFAAARASCVEDERQARSHAAEIEAMRAELHELRTSARVFQLSRCCRSGAPLELPTIHFLCGHSFNASALGEGGAEECPLCAPEHARVLGRQRALEARAAQHDAFFKQLEGSADGFATVAEFFGRGVMSARAQ